MTTLAKNLQTQVVNIRLNKAAVAELKAFAKKQQRPISNLTRMLVLMGIEELRMIEQQEAKRRQTKETREFPRVPQPRER